MTSEVRMPKEGELWWRQNSPESGGGYGDGLYLYTTGCLDRPFMCRCYGSANDLREVISPSQFASVAYHKPVDVRLSELVRGDWILAATQGKVAAFLRDQTEAYRLSIILEVNTQVAQAMSVIENGKNPDDVPPPWIKGKVE